ncbi:MAG: hypothetical protein AB1698_01090 [Pseudomonadota bacterium]
MAKPDPYIEDTSAAAGEKEGAQPGARLRCDVCGNRSVRIVSFSSPIEALRFTTARR